jgi:putative membrane-bound dehydrogenase-like protein
MAMSSNILMKPIALLSTLLLCAVPCLAEIPKPTDAPKPKTPEESAKAFQLPPGFRMEVVASEPLIASPSGVCWDERGRMFVSELHGYNLEGQLDIEELNKTGQLDTQVRRVQADEKYRQAALKGTYGVIKLLHDTDGDGRMDKADVWADDLPPAYGLVPSRGGVIVACAPDIVYLADRDGDGKAEVREVLFTGFRTGALERGVNAPQWGIDGWIYFGRGWGGSRITGPHLKEPVQLSGTDFRIRADGSAIEPVTGGTHTFGFTFTPAGDRFVVNTITPGLFVAPLPWRYLVRNPDATFTGLEVEAGNDRHAYSLAPAHPWRTKRAEDPAYFKYYRDRYGASDSDATGWFTSGCGPLIYQDSVLPGLRGQYFVCDPSANLIHRAAIQENGTMLNLRRVPGEEKSEFGASRDCWSHPISLNHGPDGCIYVVDYYREIIEDYSAIPRHLQQQYGLYNGHDRGRIYRLTHQDAKPYPITDMTKLDGKMLVAELSSTSFWRTQSAQRLIVEKGDVSELKKISFTAIHICGYAMIHNSALRSLEGLGRLTPGIVASAIMNPEFETRIQGLQLAELWVKSADKLVTDQIFKLAAIEQNPRVLLQLALTLGESQDPRAFTALANLARTQLRYRWMDSAIISSLHGRGEAMLAELLRDPGDSKALWEPLAKTIAARRDEGELARTLALLSKTSAENQTLILDALAKGRKNAPRKPLQDNSARQTLATLAASPSAEVRKATRALEDTFVLAAVEGEELAPSGALQPAMEVSDASFKKFITALSGQRDLKRGHELFQQACMTCHKVEKEGFEVGPDLMGELAVPEETLVRHILLPNEHIRPGFETIRVDTQEGTPVLGLLKDDGATSLTLVSPGGVENVLLRKDVKAVRRLPASLMPSFAETLTPTDMASLLGWLKTNLKEASTTPKK